MSGESAEFLIAAGAPLECSPFGAKVSASEGRFTTVSDKGYLGAFQFGPSTLAAYYHGDANQFLTDPAGQVTAWSHYLQDQWRIVLRNHLDSLLEQRILL